MKTVIRFICAISAAIAVFFVLSLVCGVIIKITPVPESLGFWILICVLSLVCFAAGLYAASITGNAGLVTGLAIAVTVVFVIYVIVSFVFCHGINISGILRIPYIIPLLSGAAGGIVGTNIKK